MGYVVFMGDTLTTYHIMFDRRDIVANITHRHIIAARERGVATKSRASATIAYDDSQLELFRRPMTRNHSKLSH